MLGVPGEDIVVSLSADGTLGEAGFDVPSSERSSRISSENVGDAGRDGIGADGGVDGGDDDGDVVRSTTSLPGSQKVTEFGVFFDEDCPKISFG